MHMAPAQEGEPSYPLFIKERTSLLDSLKRRAQKLHATLAGLEGVTSTVPEGALYAMPRIRLPRGALEVRAREAALRSAVHVNSHEMDGWHGAKTVPPLAYSLQHLAGGVPPNNIM